MNDSIWQSIAATPWWMYLIAYYVIYVCYRASRPRTLNFKILLYFTANFIALTFLSAYYFVHLTTENVASWCILMIFGCGAGWLYYSYLQVKAVAGEENLDIPGSWTIMFALLLLVATKFMFADELSLNPDQLLSAKNSAGLMAIYGFATGTFFGRIAYAMRVIKYGPFLAAKALAS